MPIYLVPTNDGTGKRFVHCPHPPHTTAPLPDGFNAITKRVTTRPSMTKLPIPRSTLTTTRSPSHSLRPTPTTPDTDPHTHFFSPSQSLLGFSPDVRGSRCGGDGHHGKARGVAGGERDHSRSAQDSGGVGAENALNMSPLPPPVSFPPGRGPAKGRNNLVEKLVREHREEC